MFLNKENITIELWRVLEFSENLASFLAWWKRDPFKLLVTSTQVLMRSSSIVVWCVWGPMEIGLIVCNPKFCPNEKNKSWHIDPVIALFPKRSFEWVSYNLTNVGPTKSLTNLAFTRVFPSRGPPWKVFPKPQNSVWVPRIHVWHRFE